MHMSPRKRGVKNLGHTPMQAICLYFYSFFVFCGFVVFVLFSVPVFLCLRTVFGYV